MSKSFKLFSSEKEERCSKHPNKPITMGCDTCMSPNGVSDTVCVECAVTEHRGHILCDLSEIVGRRKESLNLRVKRADAVVSRVDNILKQVKDYEASNASLSHTDCTGVKQKGEQLKEEIDKITSDFERERRENEKRNATALSTTRENMHTFSNKLKDCVNKSRAALKTAKLSKLIESEQDMDRILRKFENPNLQVPARLFQPTAKDTRKMKSLFGNFSGDDPIGNGKSDESLSTEQQNVQEGALTAQSPQSPRFVKEVYAFKHSQETIRSICIVANGKTWIARETLVSVFNDIKLVNGEGDVEETLFFSTNSGVTDISTFDDCSTVVACKDKTIRQLSADFKEHSFLFNTDLEPSSISQVTQDEFVVCFYDDGEIVKYNVKGEKVKFLSRDATMAVGEGDGYRDGTLTYTPVITYPYKVRRNSSKDGKSQLAVCNHSPHSVVVLDSDLNVQFCYNGTRVRDLGSPQAEEPPHFEPMDACFDQGGNILIADGPRSCIIMLDPQGNYLRDIVDTNMNPSALSVESNQLWIGYCNGKIEVVKYSNEQKKEWDKIEQTFAKLNTLYHH